MLPIGYRLIPVVARRASLTVLNGILGEAAAIARTDTFLGERHRR
jgi:hypothetical protein